MAESAAASRPAPSSSSPILLWPRPRPAIDLPLLRIVAVLSKSHPSPPFVSLLSLSSISTLCWSFKFSTAVVQEGGERQDGEEEGGRWGQKGL